MLQSRLPSDSGQIFLHGITTLIHLLWLTDGGIVARMQRLTTQLHICLQYGNNCAN